jgi:hypothetical protein
VDEAPSVVALTAVLLVLAGGFWVIERLAPAIRGQRRRPRETRLDLICWFFTPIVTRCVTKAAVVLVLVFVFVALGPPPLPPPAALAFPRHPSLVEGAGLAVVGARPSAQRRA